jgi:hypothetical protein
LWNAQPRGVPNFHPLSFTLRFDGVKIGHPSGLGICWTPNKLRRESLWNTQPRGVPNFYPPTPRGAQFLPPQFHPSF